MEQKLQKQKLIDALQWSIDVFKIIYRILHTSLALMVKREMLT